MSPLSPLSYAHDHGGSQDLHEFEEFLWVEQGGSYLIRQRNCYLFSILYCLVNARLSSADCVCISGFGEGGEGGLGSTGAGNLRPSDPLYPPYLQTMTTLICNTVASILCRMIYVFTKREC